MEGLIGAIAGAIPTVVTNPLDAVKTRLQLQGEGRSHQDHIRKRHFKNLPHAVFVIAKNEGLRSLQKGLCPAFIYSFFMNGVRLGIFKWAEREGYTLNERGNYSIYKEFGLSYIGGAIASVIANPAQVVKTRLQASTPVGSKLALNGIQYHYTGTMDAVRQILKQEGVKGFYAGVFASVIRISLGSALQLSTFSNRAKHFLKKKGFFKESPVANSFFASCISGLCIVIVVTPLDTCVVRLYNQGEPKNGKKTYSGLFNCIKKTYQIEGLHGLYKGFGPLYWRIAPHTTLTLVLWDVLNSTFLKDRRIKGKK